MTRRRWALVLLGVALAGWIIGGEWVSIHRDVAEDHLLDALLGLSFLAAIGLRWQRASRAERRSLTPLWVAVSILAVVYGIGASPDPLVDPFAHLLFELGVVLQISIPIVFAWGLVSSRLARSAVGDLVVELERPLPR